MFKTEFFTKNREGLRQRAKAEVLVVSANGLLQRNGDNPFAFRQDSNFWYLCGVNIPDALLVINKTGKTSLLLPEQSPNEKIFGAPNNLGLLQKTSGVDEVLEGKLGEKKLKAAITKAKSLGICAVPPGYSDRYGMFTNPAQKRISHILRQINPDIKREDIRPILSRMRMIKQAPEISAIQRAIDVTVDTIADIKSRIDSYGFEYEIEADILSGFIKRGSSGEAFGSIIAGGNNTCQLHYQANSAAIKTGPLYIDVGAEYQNYSADITRTFLLGKPTSRQQAVVSAVKEVAAYATSIARPGATVRENERKISHKMGERLISLGLINSNTFDAVRKYFPHGTSHYLGLDVHDVGDYDAPLAPGAVMTIEPGIYIPEEGMGVRIEDDILITKNGCQVLSGKLPA